MKMPAKFLFAACGIATLTCALALSAGRSVAQEGDNLCFGAGKMCTRTTVVTCDANGCTSTVSYTYYN